jgi:hypothetical protein
MGVVGDFFGEGCLTGQSLRLATAATMGGCVLTRLDKAAVLRVLPLGSRRTWSLQLKRWRGRCSSWRISARRVERSGHWED